MDDGSPARLEASLPRAAYWDPEFYAREARAIFWTSGSTSAEAKRWACPAPIAWSTCPARASLWSEETMGCTPTPTFAAIAAAGCSAAKALFAARFAVRTTVGPTRSTAGWSLRRSSPPKTCREESEALYRAGVAEWGGFIFVNVFPEAATRSLAQQLDGIPDRLQRYPLPDLRVVRTISTRWPRTGR